MKKNNSFQLNKSYSYAFSLIENLIVLFAMTIIICLTVPGMIQEKKNQENHEKISDAVMAYQAILSREILLDKKISNVKMLNIKLSKENCKTPIASFYIDENYGNCIFHTTDGLWWDMKTPSETIIAFNKENLNYESAVDDSNMNAFYITFSMNKNRKLNVLKPDETVIHLAVPQKQIASHKLQKYILDVEK